MTGVDLIGSIFGEAPRLDIIVDICRRVRRPVHIERYFRSTGFNAGPGPSVTVTQAAVEDLRKSGGRTGGPALSSLYL